MEKKNMNIIKLIGIIISIISVIYTFFFSNMEIITIIYGLSIATVSTSFPFFLEKYLERKDIEEMERYLPDFLRDLAESISAGMTLPQSIHSASEVNYGKLSKEIKKLDIQLSWGIPFPKVMKNFMRRLKKSDFIRRSVEIILEAFYSGGDMANALFSIADTTHTLQEITKERESILKEQLLIIYIIHFLFVGIIIALYKILIPLLSIQGGGGLFSELGSQLPRDYFKILFLITVIIQSICNGLVAGEARESSIISGLKHSIIMLLVALLIYSIFILPKVYDITAELDKNIVSPGEKITLTGSVLIDNSFIEGANVSVKYYGGFYSDITDESGRYDINLYAPNKRGLYNIDIIVKYSGEEYKEKVQFVVK